MNYSEIAVIGSGPGGSTSAAILAEEGFQVTLIESGEFYSPSSCKPFSMLEMEQKYKYGGINVSFGNIKVSYVEGECIGGGSEINSGLYHRLPNDILQKWVDVFKLEHAHPFEMKKYFEAVERDLKVSYMPSGTLPKASLKLKDGADILNWNCIEVPRWFDYNEGSNNKQTMTRTMVKRAISSGANIIDNTKINKLYKEGDKWFIKGITSNKQENKQFILKAKYVFLCAGTIGTAFLLRKNKINMKAGKTFYMHPSLKMIGKFKEKINSVNMGVPVHQVKEFSPYFSLGCSISTLEHLSLNMLDILYGESIVRSYWENMAAYYVMTNIGCGSILSLPFFDDPIIKYSFSKDDIKILLEGFIALGKCLFAAGATELYPVIAYSTPIKSVEELESLCFEIDYKRLQMMTIHLFSSCPMGENTNICVTDSFGKVRNVDNLYVNDGSLLCSPLGVNPQGTIMAFAYRNILNFIKVTKS